MSKHTQKQYHQQKMMQEGGVTERTAESSDTAKRVEELVRPLTRPYVMGEADRMVYIKNVVTKALLGQISEEVMKGFIVRAQCHAEVDLCLPRLRRILKK